MSCPICGKRPPKRLCPAKGEQICAICCGRERETTIDCPLECSYLSAAHRYEAEHREPIRVADFPYREVQFSIDFVYERWPLVAALGTTIVDFASRNKQIYDPDVFATLERLAETYRTLGTGIYYERLPELPLQQALYREVVDFLRQYRQTTAQQRSGFAPTSDADVFNLLVFLLRMNKTEMSARPRSRAFLGFLYARFPLPVAQVSAAEPSRIILP